MRFSLFKNVIFSTYDARKSMKVFSHILIRMFCCDAKFEVHMLFYLEEKKREKFLHESRCKDGWLDKEVHLSLSCTGYFPSLRPPSVPHWTVGQDREETISRTGGEDVHLGFRFLVCAIDNLGLYLRGPGPALFLWAHATTWLAILLFSANQVKSLKRMLLCCKIVLNQ